MMQHPSREQWASYLYGELAPQEHAILREHLQTCALCKDQVRAWQETRTALDAFSLVGTVPRTVPATRTRHLARWAAAAALLFTTIGAIALSRPHPVNEQALATRLLPALRDHLEDQFRADLHAALTAPNGAPLSDFQQQLRTDLGVWAGQTAAAATTENRRLLGEFAVTFNTALAEDRQAMRIFAAHYMSNMSRFRRDIDTLAVYSEDRYQLSQDQLGQLFALAQADQFGNAAPLRATPVSTPTTHEN